MNSSRNTIATLVATATLGASGLAVLGTVPAQARGDDDYRVSRTGSCSGFGTWKLKAKEDDGRIEVEFEVDVNRNGQTYAVRLKRDGTRFFKGTRTTKAPSGSFDVERTISNSRGDDVIVGRAVRGENVCRGQVTYRR